MDLVQRLLSASTLDLVSAAELGMTGCHITHNGCQGALEGCQNKGRSGGETLLYTCTECFPSAHRLLIPSAQR